MVWTDTDMAPTPTPSDKSGGAPPKTDVGDQTTVDDEAQQYAGGYFRGLMVAARAKLPVVKAASTKVIRSVGSNRPLAFASEGAVAGKSVMPSWAYYGAWGLSGLAITADITARTWDAPKDKKWATAFYYTSFHLPASLVVPAYIIHQVVHATEHSMEKHSYAKKLPPRVRMFAPVTAALLSIVPVVPIVDHIAEMIMEPTLGKYLGLEFHHSGHSVDDDTSKDTKQKED